jgi:hypothetical protein
MKTDPKSQSQTKEVDMDFFSLVMGPLVSMSLSNSLDLKLPSDIPEKDLNNLVTKMGSSYYKNGDQYIIPTKVGKITDLIQTEDPILSPKINMLHFSVLLSLR